MRRVLLTSVLLGLLLGGTAPLSAAQEPSASPAAASAADTGTILYTRRFVMDGEYRYQLWTIAGDGTAPTPLTTDPGLLPYAADLSADGRSVAFTVGMASDRKSSGLYVVSIDGSGLHNVVASAGSTLNEVRDPTWSPDGTQLAFVAVDKNFDRDIWTVHADGTGLHRVTTCDCAYTNTPRWSPTRNELLWSPHEFDLARLDLASGESTTIYDNAPSGAMSVSSYSWAPDGESVYFAGQGYNDAHPGVFVIGRDGSGLREIARSQDATLNGPFASPDNTRLAVSAQTLSGDQDSDVWTMDAAGSNSNVAVIHGELWEVAADWGVSCSTGCTPGGPWSSITANLSSDYKVSGGLMPGVADAPVVVQLLKKVGSRWRLARQTTASTSPYSTYEVQLPRISASMCKVKVRWAGDAQHDAAVAKTHPFGC